MSDVIFNEEPEIVIRPMSHEPKKKLSLRESLVKAGFVKDEVAADKVLISVAVVAILSTGFILVRFAFPPPHTITPAEQAEIIRMTSGGTGNT